MKKILYLFVCLLTTTTVIAQQGRIRISFAGFDCYRETWDDILHADGKGDEVYFTFALLLADKNGNTKLNYEKRTPVYGDATGQFSNRVSVGSWVDLFGNNKGGIKAGDNYRSNLLLGEYDLANGDILTVIPTGWEQDPIADNQAGFSSTIQSLVYSINQKVAPFALGLGILSGSPSAIIFGASQIGMPKLKAGGEQGELGKPGTRPIGMEKYGDFSPKLVVLNTPNLSFISNSDMGFGKGVIPVAYDETAVGNLRDHGIYTLLLKIEFFPSPNTSTTSTTAPPPPPPSSGTTYKTTTSAPITKTTGTIATTPTTSAPVSIAGTWTGTWGNGSNNGPNYYCFLLNADGTMKLLDARGNSMASGKYSFANNQLSGSYTYNGSASAFSFAATLTGTQLNGTWGAGANTSGSGRWVMNKSGNTATSIIR